MVSLFALQGVGRGVKRSRWSELNWVGLVGIGGVAFCILQYLIQHKTRVYCYH